MFKTNSTTRVATYILIGSFFIVLCGVFLCNPAKGQKTVKKEAVVTGKDSIPPGYIFRIGISELQKYVDSIYWTHQFIGQSLTVDNANLLKQIQERAIRNILKNLSLDTATLKKK